MLHRLTVFYAEMKGRTTVGTLFGIAALGPPASPIQMPAQVAVLLDQSQSDLSAFFSNVMPSIDIDWGRFETEWEAFKARIPEPWKLNNDGREFKVGEKARDRGLHAKYPVVLIPGIISTGLECVSFGLRCVILADAEVYAKVLVNF